MASKEDRVKVLVLGPTAVGKSNVANFLSGLRDTPTESYKETCPLRILETIVDGLNTAGTGRKVGKGTRANVELWDVGGNERFQGCWRAIKQDADGIIFVMNYDEPQTANVLEFWSKNFLDTKKIPVNHCVVFAHHSHKPTDDQSPQRLPALPRSLQTCRGIMETSLDSRSDNFKDAFERLVEQVLITRRRKEEEQAYQSEMTVRVGASQ